MIRRTICWLFGHRWIVADAPDAPYYTRFSYGPARGFSDNSGRHWLKIVCARCDRIAPVLDEHTGLERPWRESDR